MIRIEDTRNPVTLHFLGQAPQCQRCGKRVDVWASINEQLTQFVLISDLPIGFWHTDVTFEIDTGGTFEIYLPDHQIPPGSRVVERRYCGHGSVDKTEDLHGSGLVTVLEMHGGRPLAFGPLYEDRIRFFGAALGPGPWPRRTRHTASFTWIPPHLEIKEEGWTSLWRAFESYVKRDYRGVVVPANVAVELALSRVVSRFCISKIGSPAERQKVKDSKTHGNRLKLALPTIAHRVGAPGCSVEIIDRLEHLRVLRNEIAHTGETKSPIDAIHAGRLLAGAIFGFYYCRVVEHYLTEMPKGRRT